jgi:hypothetical protein
MITGANSTSPPFAQATHRLTQDPSGGGAGRPLPLLLVKPGRTLGEVRQGARGGGEEVGAKVVAQKIIAALDPADAGLVGGASPTAMRQRPR